MGVSKIKTKGKVGGIGQGLSDDRDRPKPTGKSLSGLVMDDLLAGIDGLRVSKVIVDKHVAQNGVEGTMVKVSFDLRNSGDAYARGDLWLERDDEWFFARHLKLSNEEMLNIMRSNLR